MKKKPQPFAPFIIVIAAAMSFRDILRKNGAFEQADKIRDALLLFGVEEEDKKVEDKK